MSIIWCSISAHGFGHAAQTISILNELGASLDDVHVILRTCVPPSIFHEYLTVKWDVQAVPQDIGCIQQGPLDIDVPGTWEAYQEFHGNWSHRVTQEAEAMHEAQADLVISNISYLAISGGFQAHRPVVAIASLCWDQVLLPFIQPSNADHQAIYEQIQLEYAKANQLVRLYPAIDMPAFPRVTDTGPSFPLVQSTSQDLRKRLGIEREETLVAIAFGGVSLTGLPLEQMEMCQGFHFLVGGIPLDSSSMRIHRIEDCQMPFGEIMRQADVIMTKPGYATITMAVHYGIPLVYVRRNNFVDEQSLVEYAHQYGRALELTREDFESGFWGKALRAVLDLSFSTEIPPQPDQRAVVDVLRGYLQV